jgi:hypothetical protein
MKKVYAGPSADIDFQTLTKITKQEFMSNVNLRNDFLIDCEVDYYADGEQYVLHNPESGMFFLFKDEID